MNTDFVLIQKMKQGDESAYDIFIRKYYEEILRYCSLHCADTKYAEDLTQETFLHFFARLSDYHFKGKTKNYLYTIAGNLCKDFYKKKKDVPTERQVLEENSGPSLDTLDGVLEKIVLEKAMEALPEKLREVIILYYFQELKLSEIAEVLQIGLSLVKYRLRQAKKMLEQLLRKEDA